MAGFTFKFEGLSDVLQVFDELAREIGDKEAKSKILVPATRKAMQPVLRAAQQNAPVDTGGLRLSLQVNIFFEISWKCHSTNPIMNLCPVAHIFVN